MFRMLAGAQQFVGRAGGISSARPSFSRFLGLAIEDSIPDATTLWLFREKLAKTGLIEKLFDRLDQHLAAKGYMARGGKIIEASIVPVPRDLVLFAPRDPLHIKNRIQQRPRVACASRALSALRLRTSCTNGSAGSLIAVPRPGPLLSTQQIRCLHHRRRMTVASLFVVVILGSASQAGASSSSSPVRLEVSKGRHQKTPTAIPAHGLEGGAKDCWGLHSRGSDGDAPSDGIDVPRWRG